MNRNVLVEIQAPREHEGTVVKSVLFNPDTRTLVLHWQWRRPGVTNCSSISLEEFRRALEVLRNQAKQLATFVIRGAPYDQELGLTAEAMEQVASEIRV